MTKTNRTKVLGLLALPLLAVAIAVVVLAWGHSSSKDTNAAVFGAVRVDLTAVGIPGCTTVGAPVSPPGAAVKCTIGKGSAFVLRLNGTTLPANFMAWQSLVTYGSLLYKPEVDFAANEHKQPRLLSVRAPDPATGKEGSVGHGDTCDLTAPFAACSGVNAIAAGSAILNLDFNCAQNGQTPGNSISQTIQLVSFKGNPSGTALVDSATVSHAVPPVALQINCEPPTATPTASNTPTPTNTPTATSTPSSPSVVKSPSLANLFLTAQGAKLPPTSCLGGSNGTTFDVSINSKVTGTDPKTGEAQALGGFQFQVNYDNSKVCVVLVAGPTFSSANGVPGICIVHDSLTKPNLQGNATIACNTIGKAPFSPPIQDPANRRLATIVVKPMPDVYSVGKPNNPNGNAVQLINKGCKITDRQGNPVAPPLGAATCNDAEVTLRWLEGDVVPDCSVNARDTQAVAFRWGTSKGSGIYNAFYNLEPSGSQSDTDIDVNDLQFVFGRFGSTCTAQWPTQNPLNPKAVPTPPAP